MKKYKLRKWVEVVLVVIGILAFIVIGSDCEDMNTFVVTHLIATGILILVGSILEVYAR